MKYWSLTNQPKDERIEVAVYHGYLATVDNRYESLTDSGDELSIGHVNSKGSPK